MVVLGWAALSYERGTPVQLAERFPSHRSFESLHFLKLPPWCMRMFWQGVAWKGRRPCRTRMLSSISQSPDLKAYASSLGQKAVGPLVCPQSEEKGGIKPTLDLGSAQVMPLHLKGRPDHLPLKAETQTPRCGDLERQAAVLDAHVVEHEPVARLQLEGVRVIPPLKGQG